MFRLIRTLFFLALFVGMGASLFPNHLDDAVSAGWQKVAAEVPGLDELRGLSTAGLASALGLAVLHGVWQSRRYRRLRAEYEYRTGATATAQEADRLRSELSEMSMRAQELRQQLALQSQLREDHRVTAKELQVRSEYGREAEEALAKLREEAAELIEAKGHGDGFREAMAWMMRHPAFTGSDPPAHKSQPLPGKIGVKRDVP